MSNLLSSSIFEDISLDTAGTAIFVVLLVVLVLAAAAVNIVPKLVHKWEIEYRTRDLTYGAVCLAMSVALSYAKMFSMPQGGSVTPAALAPLYIYCYYFGLRKGMIVSTTYTLLQFLQGAYIVSPWSAFFDYILPCFSIALVGIFAYKPQKYGEFVKRNKDAAIGAKGKFKYWAFTIGGHWGIFAGAALHAVIRYLSSALSGILFFGEWAGEGYGPVAWGFLYNTVLLVDSAIAMIVTLMLMSSRSFNLYMTASFAAKKAEAPTEGDVGSVESDPEPEHVVADSSETAATDN